MIKIILILRLLTNDNIEDYIMHQHQKFEELKVEYDNTGTIQLKGKFDKSYLGEKL